MKGHKKLKRRSKEIKSLNQTLSERLDIITKEKEHLAKENQQSKSEKLKLEKLNKDLTKEKKILITKNDKLKIELNKVKPFVEKFTFSSHKLEMILNNQKAIFDKAGLGFRSYPK